MWKRDSSAISNVFSDTRCGLTAVIETFASVDKIVPSLLTSLVEQKQGWKKPRFFGNFFRFLGFLGFLGFKVFFRF